MVAPGTYPEFLTFEIADVTLRSEDPKDPSVVAATVIDDPTTFPFITFDIAVSGIRIAGLTIHGDQEGIQCNGHPTTIEDCVITSGKIERFNHNGKLLNCKITVEGGIENCNGLIQGNEITNGRGIFSSLIVPCNADVIDNVISHTGTAISWCRGDIEGNRLVFNSRAISSCDGVIRNNTIALNSWQSGCGLSYCDGIIEGNLVYGNMALINPTAGPLQTVGAGLLNCNGTIRNNLIFNNYSETRGAGLAGCSGVVVNNTIFGNHAEENGGGIYYCNGVIRNNIIWGNEATSGAQIDNSTTPSYCDIQDWSGEGTENSSVDPRLADPDNGDFRLTPESPCIDAGAFVEGLDIDFWGDPRPVDVVPEPRGDGSNFDIGADEFYIQMNPRSDIFRDYWIDFLDLFVFSTGWQLSTGPNDNRDIDLNQDIDGLDLLILLKDWGQGTGPK